MTTPEMRMSCPAPAPVRAARIARRHRLLICDLDHTLFDWTHAWAAGFEALLGVLRQARPADDRSGRCNGRDRNGRDGDGEADLLATLKQLHSRHGTTDLRDVLGLALMDARASGAASASVPAAPFATIASFATFARAAKAQRDAYAKALALYAGVLETLGVLREDGVRIVVYTESPRLVSEARIRRLGLDGLVDTLFASPDPALPRGAHVDALALWPGDDVAWRCEQTMCACLPQGIEKPDPRALQAILARCGGSAAASSVYVGDHPDKDVAMANRAGVTSVWARYGTRRDPRELALLDAVCHWSPAAAATPASGATPPAATADIILDRFDDLLRAPILR